MGGGSYSESVHTATRAANRAAGRPTFAYTAATSATPQSTWKAHETLDPHGMTVRESRDSDEHPTSKPIAVLFDVTGSMLDVPKVMQSKLNQLYGLVLRKGYVEHPQVLFGAIGDATSDTVPFQVGQFESDNRADEQLTNIFLEGNGGGQFHESYELGLYFLARKTACDAFEKRGEKGIAFLIGDELARDVAPSAVRKVFGDELGEPVAFKQILAEAQEKWIIYFIIPQHTSHANDPRLIEFWRDALGQYTLQVDDPDNIAEVIALTVGLEEGAIDDLDDGLDHLDEVGSGAAKGSVSKALAHVGSSGPVASASGVIDGTDGSDPVGRL